MLGQPPERTRVGRLLASAAQGRLSRFRVWLRDPVRLAFLHLLIPAADYLSAEHALALAALAGRLDASRFLNAGARLEMQRAFGLDHRSATVAAQDWATTRYTDLVIHRRIENGKEDPATWRIVEKNAEVVDELRRSNASFVVATGHFVRHASYVLWTGMTIPQRIVGVSLPKRDRTSGRSFRSRLTAGHMEHILGVWEQTSDIEIVTVDHEMCAAIVASRLRHPGTAALISVDAYAGLEGPVVHSRGYAGWRLRTLAVGTAMIARFAHCPIVVCHPYVEDDGTIVLEWVGPFTVDDDGPEGDVEVMDMIFDELERMVGRRPTQYLFPIGSERRWDPVTERWIEREPQPVLEVRAALVRS
jgi:lauroyl/myristoyl acyltransferase